MKVKLTTEAIQSLLKKKDPLADMPLAKRNEWVVALHAAGIESDAPSKELKDLKRLQDFYQAAKKAALADTKIAVDKDGKYTAKELTEKLDRINTVIQELLPGNDKSSIYRVRTEENRIQGEIAALLGYSSFEKLTKDEKAAKREEMLEGFKEDIKTWKDIVPINAYYQILYLYTRAGSLLRRAENKDETTFIGELRKYLKVELDKLNEYEGNPET